MLALRERPSLQRLVSQSFKLANLPKAYSMTSVEIYRGVASASKPERILVHNLSLLQLSYSFVIEET